MKSFFLLLGLALAPAGATACDLCAVYNADAANAGSTSGFSLSLAEQFIPYRTFQVDGEEPPPSFLDDAFVDSSITHLVPTWNFSERFGLSLNVPYVHKHFFRYQRTGTGIISEGGTESGLGDASLIARVTVYRTMSAEGSLFVNLLGGVKFPTGDADRVAEEVSTTRELDVIYGPGHQHAIGGVHLRDIALGSGSWDGVFGVTANSRWKRLLLNAQFQYYLRTPGESDYEYGDEWMLSGGPGVFLVLSDSFSLSLQALAVYDHMQPDILLGRENRNTGMEAVYLGPQAGLSIGEHFSANVGVDVPLEIENQGQQNVPDWRLHGGLSWRF
jgi:hypothetical protein